MCSRTVVLLLPGVRLTVAPNIVALICIDSGCGIRLVAVIGSASGFRPLQFLLFTTLAVLLLMLSVNEILLVMRDDRLRYLMALWPMSALLIGWGVWRARGRWRLVAGSLTGVLVIFGLWANTASELRYEFYELYCGAIPYTWPVCESFKFTPAHLICCCSDNQPYQTATTYPRYRYYFDLLSKTTWYICRIRPIRGRNYRERCRSIGVSGYWLAKPTV